jgi:nucleoside-diphosphate-sugar epimerase
MNFTILGASGFIGSHLAVFLKSQGHYVNTPERNAQIDEGENLGHIIYAIGLTADFRQKPLETVEAHVCKLVAFLKKAKFESFLYLSSTRIYSGAEEGCEGVKIKVDPSDFSDLYNISKIMGESTCLAVNNPKVRIARLANVIGNDFDSDNFIFSLVKEATEHGKIKLMSHPLSQKDYISIRDVVSLIPQIAERGKDRIYNVASGLNITNGELLNTIKECINCRVEISENSPKYVFPAISIERIRSEFSFKPVHILEEIKPLIKNYQKK